MKKSVILKYLLFVPIGLFMAFTAYLMAPLVALWSLKFDVQNNWYCTRDNPVDGEAWFIARYPGWEWHEKLYRRTRWMWRNKAYNFRWKYLGIDQAKDSLLWEQKTIISSNIIPDHFHLKSYTKDAFKLFGYVPYGNLGFGFRYYIGWKLDESKDYRPNHRAMLAININPFKPNKKAVSG